VPFFPGLAAAPARLVGYARRVIFLAARDRIPYVFTLRAAHVLSELHFVVPHYFRRTSFARADTPLAGRPRVLTISRTSTVTISHDKYAVESRSGLGLKSK